MVALAPLYMGVGTGTLGAISVFLKPLVAEFGWPRGNTSLSYLAGMASAGMIGLLMGHLSDRFSTRRVVMGGALVMGGGFLAMAHLDSLWEFLLLSTISMGAGGAAFFTPVLANVGGWFTRNRGLAMGIATAGQALGQGLVPYSIGLLIAGSGWRYTYTVMGIAVLVTLLPLALLIRTPPSRSQNTGYTPVSRDALGDIASYAPSQVTLSFLSIAVIFCCITMATPLVHVVALASDRGLPPEGAARVLLILMVGGFFGRIFFGRLSDRIGPMRTYMITSAWQSLTVFWFVWMSSPPSFYIMAAFFGFGFGGVMTSLVLCAQKFARPEKIGFATALVMMFAMFGMGLGATQGGFFFDLLGDYTISYLNATMAGGINLMVLSLMEGYILRKRDLNGLVLSPA